VSEDVLEQNGVSWRSERQQFVHLPTGVEFASVKKKNGLKILDATPIPPAQLHFASMEDIKPTTDTNL
jgi:hypothetical protein